MTKSTSMRNTKAGTFKVMQYKKELRRRVANLLMARKQHGRSRVRPSFAILDSLKEKHFGVLIQQDDVPYFARKAKKYGLSFDRDTLFKPIGAFEELRLLNVHIIEEPKKTSKKTDK